MFEGFTATRIQGEGVGIHAMVGGRGPALLLLHGFPQSHVIWHRVAGELARHFTVVATDLRGYGESDAPPGLSDHSNYSKRVMAADQVAVMRALGHERFALVGHDRGGRVAHRLAVDHPERVTRLVTLDIAPTLAMYEQTNEAFARAYYHWFWLIRPAPFPERLISADPDFFLAQHMGTRSAGMAPFSPEALAAYQRHLAEPARVHAMCEDYRASANIDMVLDRADRDAGVGIRCPMMALWGEHGIIGKMFDPLAEWRRVSRSSVTGKSLACGHYVPEEVPEALLGELLPFLAAGSNES